MWHNHNRNVRFPFGGAEHEGMFQLYGNIDSIVYNIDNSI